MSSAQNTDKWDADAYPWSEEARATLRDTFKLPDFRPLQRAAINAVLSNEDALLIMSTGRLPIDLSIFRIHFIDFYPGAGKSLTYQLPAVMKLQKQDSITLVVCPLVFLALKKLSIGN